MLGPGSTVAGYRVEGLLGRGGMGAVYRAQGLEDGRTVALKLLPLELTDDPRAVARFEREARLVGSLSEPHVIPVYDAGEHEGTLYMAMHLVEGTDLEALLAARGALHPRYATDVVAGVAGALDAAHANDLVHRDVKPGNVLLEARGEDVQVYLSDFGLSKHRLSQSGVTRTGHWVGTVDYAAPEQVQAQDVDARTDVYALGCVLYEALCGQVPFPRTREVDKLMAHVAEPAPRVTDVDFGIPEAFDDVISRALAKTPGDRFPSAGGLAEAAVAAAGEAGAPSEPMLPSEPVPRPSGHDSSAPTAG